MKKKILLFAMAAALLAVGCDKNEGGGAEEGRRLITLTFEGSEWDAKVDSPQYQGKLLYDTEADSENHYSWYDPATDLYSELNFSYDSYMFWNGGCAVSNYFSRDIESNNDYKSQLTVCADGARSGRNCIVCDGYLSPFKDSRPSIEFRDGEGVIENLYICTTTYWNHAAKYGDSMADKLGGSDWLKIVATGYTRAAGGVEKEGASVEFYLFRDGEFTVDDWTEWNLSGLGTIWKVKFDMQWSGGADTFFIPAYFAIDDITVVE